MKSIKNQEALISGASIAGLSTAWWLNHIGYQVTVVEMASAPRTAGGAVDLVGDTTGIVKRMGLYEQLKAHSLGVDRIEFKNSDDITEGRMILRDMQTEPNPAVDDIEIERQKFVDVLLYDLKDKVEFIFNESVCTLTEQDDDVIVSFKRSAPRRFDLVVGCDGSHSNIRKLYFGPENDYSIFLGAYFSISIVPALLIPERTMQMYRVPHKSVMLNAYNGKTDIIFTFLSDEEIDYDYRDIAAQRQIITEQFVLKGWRIPELLNDVERSGNFYFDKFCQIKMPSWSKGRVVLVGDAAYCASPAAGQGASLSLRGAEALADALQKHNGDWLTGFAEYEANLRLHVTEIQHMAERNVKENFMLKTEEEIRRHNKEARLF